MRPETQKALLATAGRYIRKLMGELELRIKAIEDRQSAVPDMVSRAVAEIPVPKDGKSVTVEEVLEVIGPRMEDRLEAVVAKALLELERKAQEVVERAVAAIPRPKDGSSVTLQDVEPLLRTMVDALPEPKQGDPGKSITLDELRPVVEEAVQRAVSAMPAPKDGKSVSLEEVMEPIAEQIRTAVASLPPPQDGRDADPEDVRRMVQAAVDTLPKPQDGRSVDMDEVKALVLEAVAKLPTPVDGKDADPAEIARQVEAAVAALPKPKDGPGLEEVRQIVAAAVADIPVPKDGTSVTVDEVLAAMTTRIEDRVEATIARGLLDVERRAQGVLERAVASIPRPKDGRDGLDLRHFSVEQDDDCRTVLLTLKDDQRTEHVHLTFPVVLDRGVFSEKGLPSGAMYERGDGVTYGGSFWIAQVDGPEGVPGMSRDWRLAVKKGRDGKPVAKLPTPPPTVKLAPDLRHVAPPERNPVPERES